MTKTRIRIFLFSAAAACVCLAVAADEEAKFLPAGPGKDAVIKYCTECHGSDNVRMKRLDSDEWADTVAQMVDHGAKANQQEQAAIVAYLAQNFGKNSKVLINTAPLTELKSVLDFNITEAKAVLAYRNEHGDFKDWHDLLKVPGLPAAKVEAKKDLLTF
jgi:competence protein ComEA